MAYDTMIRGLMMGVGLRQQLEDHRQRQAMNEQLTQMRDRDMELDDIKTRMMLEGAGRPIRGGVVEMPGTAGPRLSPLEASLTLSRENPGTSAFLPGASGNVEGRGSANLHALQDQDPLAGLPGFVRKADPSRSVRYKTRGGDTIERELYSPEEQIQQMLQRIDTEKNAESLAKIRELMQLGPIQADNARRIAAAQAHGQREGMPTRTIEGWDGPMTPNDAAQAALADQRMNPPPPMDEVTGWDRTVGEGGQVFNTPRYKSGKLGEPKALPGVRERKPQGMGGGGGTSGLTTEGLDLAALQFAKTGSMPTLGMGASTTRQAIINRAAELYPSLDVASNQAAFRANQQSLAALQKSRDAVAAFEQTALKNLDLFTDQAKQIIDSGSPLLNFPLRAVTQKMVGSEKFQAFQAARRVAVNEIARVTSNPNLTGVLSDSARHEVESFIPESATLKEVFRVANVLRQDMRNRRESMDEEISAVKSRIGGGSAPAHSTGKGATAYTEDQIREAAQRSGRDPDDAVRIARERGVLK